MQRKGTILLTNLWLKVGDWSQKRHESFTSIIHHTTNEPAMRGFPRAQNGGQGMPYKPKKYGVRNEHIRGRAKPAFRKTQRL